MEIGVYGLKPKSMSIVEPHILKDGTIKVYAQIKIEGANNNAIRLHFESYEEIYDILCNALVQVSKYIDGMDI